MKFTNNPARGEYLLQGPDGAVELHNPGRPTFTEHAVADVHGRGLGSSNPCAILGGALCWRTDSPMPSGGHLKAYRDGDEEKIKNWLLEEYAGLASLVQAHRKAHAS